MKNKRKKWLQHLIAFVLVMAMLLPMTSTVNVQAAENDLYLAYQNTETGKAVTKLDEKWEHKADYKVTELFLNKGEKVDLCFINASNWKNPKWTSSNSKVVSVDSSGVITALSDGVAEITLTYTKKITGKKVSASAMVYVGENNWDIHIAASGICCFMDTYELKVGDKWLSLDLFEEEMNYSLEQRSSYAEQSWVVEEWKSSNENIVKVYGGFIGSARVVPVKAGGAIITVTITNKVLNTSIVKNITVNVSNPAYKESVAWGNKYYQMYGENYKRMFKTVALNSTLDIEADILNDAWINWSNKMQAIGVSGFAELVDVTNGLTIAFEGIVNGKNYREEKGHQDAVLHLVKEITTAETINQHYIGNVQEALEKAKGLFTDLDNVNKFSEAIEKIKTAGLDIPEAEQKTIVGYVMNDAAGDIKDILSEGVTISEYLALTMCLYEMDCKILDDLQKCSEPGETLYEDVELVRKAKAEDPEKFFKERYCTDAFVRIAVKTIVKLAGKEAMNLLSVTGEFIKMWIEIAGVNKLSELTKATHLMGYAVCAFEKVSYLRDEIRTNYDSYTDSELMEKIDDYETVYRLFLSISEVTIETIRELDYTCSDELSDDWSLVVNDYHYDTHIATAMAWYMNQNPTADEHEPVKNATPSGQTFVTTIPTEQFFIEKHSNLNVVPKMDKLYGLLENKYFTVNQKACSTKRLSAHGCTNCNMRDIAQTDWFTKIFGTLNVDNFPEHDVDSSRRDHTGQSCFGFACAMQYLLFANSANEKLESERIAAVKFNKANMEKYVQPGDVVRVNGHSVLVYSIEKDGLMVLDCNWNSGGQLNCLVQKHLLSYSNEYYAGYTAYINRVKKVIDSENQAGQYGINDISQTQIVVLKSGDKNLNVQYFQQNLYYLGYTVGDFDGDYGKKTSTAVKNLQKDLQMEQTGEVNMYLYLLVNNSMKEIQQYLTEKGYYSLEVDGIAGPGTSKAIAKLQAEWGMSATGRVNVELMQKIIEKKGTSAVQNLADYVNLLK